MTCHEIIKKYLKDNGFDGLYNQGECGCLIDDLVPCGQDFSNCEPGYKYIDERMVEYDFMIGSKEAKEDAEEHSTES